MVAALWAGPSAFWIAPHGGEEPKSAPAKDARRKSRRPRPSRRSPSSGWRGGDRVAGGRDLPVRRRRERLAEGPGRADEQGRRRRQTSRRWSCSPKAGRWGAAQVEEIRQAMAKVRAPARRSTSTPTRWAMGEYVLLSGASRLSVVPTADLWVTGLYAEQPYLRGLLDKLGVTARLPDLRRLQERRRDVHARRPQPRGRRDDELAARRHCTRPTSSLIAQGRERRAGEGQASGSTAARTPPRRRRRPA